MSVRVLVRSTRVWRPSVASRRRIVRWGRWVVPFEEVEGEEGGS
jgi:hypothetical protein